MLAPATQGHGSGLTSCVSLLWSTLVQPLPKGQKREKEDWENIWYWGMGGGLLFMTIGYLYKPDTR